MRPVHLVCQGIDTDNPTMQSDKSEKVVRPRTTRKTGEKGAEEVLSAVELQRAAWGREFKRYVKTAAASREIYEDAVLAERAGVTRNTVQGWWRGARPGGETAVRLARALGLPTDALLRYVYGGEEPTAAPAPAVQLEPEAAAAWGQQQLAQSPPPQPAPAPARARSSRPRPER